MADLRSQSSYVFKGAYRTATGAIRVCMNGVCPRRVASKLRAARLKDPPTQYELSPSDRSNRPAARNYSPPPLTSHAHHTL